MIRLSQLKPGMEDVFDRFPQLSAIWSDKNLQTLAEDSTRKELALMALRPERDNGPIFLILDVEERSRALRVVGMTGFFFTEKDPENVHLRWHGIAPTERGKGFAREALEQVREIVRATQPQARRLLEMLPCSEGRAEIEPFFAALGFKPRGPEETHPWATHAWQPIALELAPAPALSGAGKEPQGVAANAERVESDAEKPAAGIAAQRETQKATGGRRPPKAP